MHFVQQHAIGLFIGYVVFQNAVRTMPTPQPQWGPLYQWAFDFFHGLALDGARIIATKFPGVMPGSSNGAGK